MPVLTDNLAQIFLGILNTVLANGLVFVWVWSFYDFYSTGRTIIIGVISTFLIAEPFALSTIAFNRFKCKFSSYLTVTHRLCHASDEFPVLHGKFLEALTLSQSEAFKWFIIVKYFSFESSS